MCVLRQLPIFIFLLVVPSSAMATDKPRLKVAVASNFSQTLEKIVDAFECECQVDIISGSSTKLAKQISLHAPYDVFLSADKKRAVWLMNEMKIPKEMSFHYATGELVFAVHRSLDGSTIEEVLAQSKLEKFAMARPEVAPYGTATKEFLNKIKLDQNKQAKIVFGANANQTIQYLMLDSVKAAFVAKSHAKLLDAKKYRVLKVPHDLYTPIQQFLVELPSQHRNHLSKKFLKHIKSKEARDIMKKDGYLF